MSDYSESAPAPEPETAPAPAPAKKEKKTGVPRTKMTDKQKKDLNKHMEKVGKNMTPSEKKSHRMKMMGRMRKGMSVNKAHKDISQ
jgi:hypothetical protein